MTQQAEAGDIGAPVRTRREHGFTGGLIQRQHGTNCALYVLVFRDPAQVKENLRALFNHR